MSEEFILKACKSFQRHVDTIIEKMVVILNKFTVLCLSSYFVVFVLKLKLILFYNRAIYYYTRIFLIFLLHLVKNITRIHKCVPMDEMCTLFMFRVYEKGYQKWGFICLLWCFSFKYQGKQKCHSADDETNLFNEQ